MLDMMIMVLLASLGVAAVSMAISKAKIGERFRDLVAKADIPSLTYMVSCPFCVGFWVTVVWMLFSGNSVMTGLSVWGAQTLVVGLMLRALFIHEAEIAMMQDEIDALRQLAQESE